MCISMGRKREVILCLLDLSSVSATIKTSYFSDCITLVLMTVHWSGSVLVVKISPLQLKYVIMFHIDVVYCVPQGSVLGSAFFNIYYIRLDHVIRKYRIICMPMILNCTWILTIVRRTEGACSMAVPAMRTRSRTSALRMPSAHPANHM